VSRFANRVPSRTGRSVAELWRDRVRSAEVAAILKPWCLSETPHLSTFLKRTLSFVELYFNRERGYLSARILRKSVKRLHIHRRTKPC
jgi:hypothetical protein